ncbi:MAG: DMT family transporter [Pseudomonadota bacterium]
MPPADLQPAPLDPTPERPAVDNMRGIAWLLVSVLGATAMTVAVRQLSLEVESPMILLLRAGVTVLLLLPVLLVSPGLRGSLRFSRPRQHLLRGGCIGVSTMLGFYAIAELPLATAVVLFFTAPIWATLLAVLLQGERVGPRRVAAIVAGFAGALVILRPGVVPADPAMFAALASSMLFAFALTMSRALAVADGPMSTFVSSVVISVVVALPFAVPIWQLPVGLLGVLTTLLLVFSGGLRNVADIQAYRLGEASILAPVSYLRLVSIGAAAYVLFDETPDGATLLGAAIIVGATLYIARREAQKR